MIIGGYRNRIKLYHCSMFHDHSTGISYLQVQVQVVKN